MKNTLTLTAILIVQLIFCQITPTRIQSKKIKELVTPEKLIEWSKGLSNEKRQRKVIDSLEIETEKMRGFLERQKLKISELSKVDEEIEKSTNQIDEINENIISRDFKSRFNVFLEFEVPKLNFNASKIKVDALYNTRYFDTGIRGKMLSKENEMIFDYSVIVRFKIF